MESMEYLVKLASFGTAGVCVLVIFFIGYNISRLPNDTSPSKVAVLGKFMNTSILIAIICAISGIANAYFNQNKVVLAENKQEIAENKLEDFGNIYEIESDQWIKSKENMEDELNTLKTTLIQNSSVSQVSIEKIENLSTMVNEQRIKTKAEIMKGLGRVNPE